MTTHPSTPRSRHHTQNPEVQVQGQGGEATPQVDTRLVAKLRALQQGPVSMKLVGCQTFGTQVSASRTTNQMFTYICQSIDLNLISAMDLLNYTL